MIRLLRRLVRRTDPVPAAADAITRSRSILADVDQHLVNAADWLLPPLTDISAGQSAEIDRIRTAIGAARTALEEATR
ncbi:hypothetical protein [Micromonospora cathayae]|uniref:Uncharacterized protein n=1 Tax=Micromonospora cathayae TaxID=3028804 RepID=A0ABY7ZZ46_9ACTN|nr:hypothetical protein [Micromonospora sp. HUAS 3]WDZ87164.1 hypothetical protein PVK37_12550 [Micromonospora sp. HUAS 3]